MQRYSTASVDYVAIGQRLRAYRMAANLLAEDVAKKIGLSRAAVYQIERGEIVKIDTLERLAKLLKTSVATLLGVDHEYYTSALGLFERYRQLEETADRIIAHFEPLSLALTTDDYLDDLRETLAEILPRDDEERRLNDIDQFIQIMRERKTLFEQRKPHFITLTGLRELERFVVNGIGGRPNPPKKVRAMRVAAARREVEHIADLMENEDFHVQVGLIDEAMPATTFQIFSSAERKTLAISPFRLGDLPNMHNGIAMMTNSAEAVRQYEDWIGRLWRRATKGANGAKTIRTMLRKTKPSAA